MKIKIDSHGLSSLSKIHGEVLEVKDIKTFDFASGTKTYYVVEFKGETFEVKEDLAELQLEGKSKTIVGFINTTLKGQRIVFGEITEHRAHKIIAAIIGDIAAFSNEAKEVEQYCKIHYNYGKV